MICLFVGFEDVRDLICREVDVCVLYFDLCMGDLGFCLPSNCRSVHVGGVGCSGLGVDG